MPDSYKFFAFISYSHRDKREAVRLQRMLERYHLPASLRKSMGQEVPKRFRVFRDEDEFTFDELGEAMEQKLRESKYLIVICSPHSAQSKYVGHEIAYFRSLSPDHSRRIIPFIISGDPTASFHPKLSADGLELLGIDLQAQGGRTLRWRFHKAFIRIVAGMLGLDFSVLWKKRQRYLAKLWAGAILLVALLAGLTAYGLSQRPFDATLTLSEADPHTHLRLSNDGRDYVCLCLGNMRTAFIDRIDTSLTFTDIPGSFRHRKVRVVCDAYGCQRIDTLLTLEQNNHLSVRRNPETFGRLRWQVVDTDGSTPLAHARFDFGFLQATTSADGLLDTLIPLPHQCADGYNPAITASDGTPRTLFAPLLPYEDRTETGTIIVNL